MATSTKSDQYITNQSLFVQSAVTRLTSSDFNLSAKERITMKWNDCMLVLFYTENEESKTLMTIWANAAKQVAGPKFGAVNLLFERKIAETFANLNSEDTPLKWAALKQVPFIIVYRNGWPVAFYNGERNVQAIIDYSLTLACKSEYYETIQLFGSMKATDNFEMGGLKEYDPKRTESIQYTANNPVRQYNEDVGLVVADKSKQVQQLATPTSASSAPVTAASPIEAPVAGAASTPVTTPTSSPSITSQ